MKCVKLRSKDSSINANIDIPSSKSETHRTIISAGLCDGQNIIDNVFFSEDILATINAMENLGADINQLKNKVIINGIEDIERKCDTRFINCSESGSTLRFIIPIALLSNEETVFTGRGKLIKRPIYPYYEIFENQNISYENVNMGLPLTLKGKLKPDIFYLRGDISSQFITGLMFALPLLNGDSKIKIIGELESKGYVDMTIDTLSKFSIHIQNNEYKEFHIKGNQKYIPLNDIFKLEGDFSQAAFFISAGILAGQSHCKNVDINSCQPDKVIIDIIKDMGGNIDIGNNIISAYRSSLNGTTVDVSQCPDLVPILAVLASLSSGTTKIVNASRLRIKESDRLKAISTELNKMGAQIIEGKDFLKIKGKKQLKGGVVDSWNDHRIAMALSIASLKCSEELIIKNSDCVKKSYPGFFEDFKRLGGSADEFSMG